MVDTIKSKLVSANRRFKGKKINSKFNEVPTLYLYTLSQIDSTLKTTIKLLGKLDDNKSFPGRADVIFPLYLKILITKTRQTIIKVGLTNRYLLLLKQIRKKNLELLFSIFFQYYFNIFNIEQFKE